MFVTALQPVAAFHLFYLYCDVQSLTEACRSQEAFDCIAFCADTCSQVVNHRSIGPQIPADTCSASSQHVEV